MRFERSMPPPLPEQKPRKKKVEDEADFEPVSSSGVESPWGSVNEFEMLPPETEPSFSQEEVTDDAGEDRQSGIHKTPYAPRVIASMEVPGTFTEPRRTKKGFIVDGAMRLEGDRSKPPFAPSRLEHDADASMLVARAATYGPKKKGRPGKRRAA